MRIKFFGILIATLLAVSCERNIPMTENIPETTPQVMAPESGTVLKGYIRVKMNEEFTDTASLGRLFPDLNIVSIERTFPYCGKFEARTRAKGLHLWYDISFDPNVPLTKAATDFTYLEGVQYVEFIKGIRPTEVPYPFNDPQLSKQWHYYNPGSEDGKYLSGSDINLFKAWEVNTGSSDVIVAITDSGVDWKHEDLASNMWVNEAEYYGTEGVDDDQNGYVDDIYGYNFCLTSDGAFAGDISPENHGTHVAGIVSAVNNNGIGVCGIAGGNGKTPGTRIMSCQIMTEGTDKANNERAFKYAADNGAVISQNSWGFEDPEYFPQSLKEAIDYFIEFAGIDENGIQTGPMRGGIVLFAAGNDNVSQAAVAMYEKVMAVSAIGPAFRKASFSNYGKWIDIAAPGGTQIGNDVYTIRSTIVGNNYGGMMGTSQACPHVSGIAALVVSQFGKVGFTNDMLWDILISNTTNIDEYNSAYVGRLGSGLIDAYKCLSKEGPNSPNPVSDIWASSISNAITLKWLVPADIDSGKAFGYDLYYSRRSLEDLDPDNKSDDVLLVSCRTGILDVGDTVSTTLRNLAFDQTYYFRIISYDNFAHRAPLSKQLSHNTQQNNNPVITSKNGTSVTLKAFETKKLAFEISDPDGHDIIATFESGSNAASAARNDNVITVTINGPYTSAGTYEAILTVSDPYGGVTNQSISYTILPNTAPHVIGVPNNVYMKNKSESVTLDMKNYFADDDGETLTYEIASSSTSIIVKPTFNEDILTLQGNWFGTTTLTITAKDALGASCQTNFTVLLRDGKQDFDLYPNPVSDVLNIRMGEEQLVDIAIFTVTGAKVFETKGNVSPFHPVQVNTTAWSAGTYTVIIKFDNKQIRGNVVKL